jgi:hypothetical protein
MCEVYRNVPGLMLLPRQKMMRGQAEVTFLQEYCLFDSVFRFVCDGWQYRANLLHQALREIRFIR